ncbi:unnamed protein product, partial [Prorocentrum cordatum]
EGGAAPQQDGRADGLRLEKMAGTIGYIRIHHAAEDADDDECDQKKKAKNKT